MDFCVAMKEQTKIISNENNKRINLYSQENIHTHASNMLLH